MRSSLLSYFKACLGRQGHGKRSQDLPYIKELDDIDDESTIGDCRLASTDRTTSEYETDVEQKGRKHLMQSIRAGVIGEGQIFQTPYGHRRITYADYTASGRSLTYIEDYIRQHVLPFYANTHSEVSCTGKRMIRLREGARETIHRCVGGGPDDVVIALGSGSTAAIHRVVETLGLRRYSSSTISIPEDERPIVFVGPYEHHSNELPWRESIAQVVRIEADNEGHICQLDLVQQLVRYEHRRLKIGSFSAGSNVTGILSDTHAITRLLHQHGALAFWDYAAAGPYVDIDMNPDGPGSGLRNKDAVFLSPHKFIGGPSTPGLLVAKRHLFRNTVPSVPGGGTVSFVTPDSHGYLPDIVHREEGGTPDIIGMIRAGLVFQLKQDVGASTIERREQAFVRAAMQHWRANPRIQLLGNLDADRLSIVSFLVRDAQGRAYHQNLIVALLNDLFGIQARGGCSCAGPYGHYLLRIDKSTSNTLAGAAAAGFEGVKPGWVRLNFNYFISKASFAFLLAAVDFVAENAGWFLPQYEFDMGSGVWTHRDMVETPDVSFGEMAGWSAQKGSLGTQVSEAVFPQYLAEASRLLVKAKRVEPTGSARAITWPRYVEDARWFPL